MRALQELGVCHEALPTSISKPAPREPGSHDDQRELAPGRQRVPVLREHAGRAGRAAVPELVHVEQVARRWICARSHTAFSISRFAWWPTNTMSARLPRRCGTSSFSVATVLRIANPWTADPSCAKWPPVGMTTLFQPGRVRMHDALAHADRRRDARRDDRGRAAVAPQHCGPPVTVVHGAGRVLDVDHEHVVGQRLRAHQSQVVQLHGEARARRVEVVGRRVDAEFGGYQARLGGDRVLRRAAARDHEADLRRADAGPLHGQPRGPGTGLGVRVQRPARRFERVLVPRPDDVVQRQDRPARPDAHALHDPRVVGPDVERRQERVVDPVLGVKVTGAVDEEISRPRFGVRQCAHPRPHESGRR